MEQVDIIEQLRILEKKQVELIEFIRLIDQKLDLLIEAITIQKKKEKLFGEWSEEKEIIKLTKLSRTTLLKLREEGKIDRSSITGKTNYYKPSDFKRLLDKNNK